MFYFTCGIILIYSVRRVHLYRIMSINTSCDSYRISFYWLLGIIRSRVCIWSYFYLDREESYNRFSKLLGVFIVRIVLLILFSNLFMTLIGWDGLGVTSFLLVIYYKNRKSLGSGLITALRNRIGDSLYICLLGFSLFNANVSSLILLILLSITKRAQIPFSSWLPAAISAPTPVRALVHSSTLVTAGVYVLIRYCGSDIGPLFFVGSITILLAGLCACVESDLKKVIALRTLSQLGVMIVSLGSQEKSYCFFHLISHACFKALLFMGVGFWIHSIYATQEYRSYNIMTGSTYVSVLLTVANLSLMGFLFTSGFYRKDAILERLTVSTINAWTIILFLIAIGLTTCYSVKILRCTLFHNTFSNSSSSRIGLACWKVKIPLLILSLARVAFGTLLTQHTSPLMVSLNHLDKIAPFLLILTGLIAGFVASSFHGTLLSGMLFLVPLTQLNRSLVVLDHQRAIDKGWVEIFSSSLSSFSSAALNHNITVIGIGLSIFFITKTI